MGLPFAVWRSMLQPASYQGVGFHVDNITQQSGRRTVVHEFPERDVPFTEDMGRRARRWTISAYIVDQDYIPYRDALIAVLEIGGQGTLITPTLGFQMVMLDSYAVTENRERGGMCMFQLTFVEAGSLTGIGISINTAAAAFGAGAALIAGAASTLNTALSSSLNSGGTVTPITSPTIAPYTISI